MSCVVAGSIPELLVSGMAEIEKTPTPTPATNGSGSTSLTIGFPPTPPAYHPYRHGWFLDTHIRVFQTVIQPSTKVIIELGSWYGSSTRWFVENSNAMIYAIDLWDDSFILNDNHYNRSHELKSMLQSHPLYPTFLANLWEYKDRVIPLRMKTVDGLQYLHDQGSVDDPPS